MNKLEIHECSLNIRYDLPAFVWDKIVIVYEKTEGWIGFGKDGNGQTGIPYWFGYEDTEKTISASVEPSGLHFVANMDTNEWNQWKRDFKKVATKVLQFKVGEIEEGEVTDEIEWL